MRKTVGIEYTVNKWHYYTYMSMNLVFALMLFLGIFWYHLKKKNILIQ